MTEQEALAARAGRRTPPAALAILALAWPLAAAWALEAGSAGMMASVVAFLVLPALPLAVRRPRTALSALAFSVLVGAPAIVWIDELATRNGQWLVVDPLPASVPLVGASLQSLSWAAAHFFATVMVWEQIVGTHGYRRPRPGRVAAAVSISSACLAAFLAVRSLHPDLLDVPYFYLGFGVALVLTPVLAACALRPHLIAPLAILAVAGCYWKLVYEITALRNDWWRFPGEFVGWIDAGPYRFPVEELVVWIVLFSPAIAVYWEFWSGPSRDGRSP